MSILQELAECERIGKTVALCNIISTHGSTPRHSGSKMLVYPDRHTTGTIGGGELEEKVIVAALNGFNDGQSRLVQYQYSSVSNDTTTTQTGSVEVFVEPILPKVTIVVVGGGHVGQKVASLAKWLDFRVIVSDERQDFCNAEAVPGADQYVCCKLSELPQRIIITHSTYFVLITRGAEIDIEGLPSILESNPAYIGVIGSRKRWETTKRELSTKGISKERLSKIHSPIGLDLNAETPQEIALSILGEIVKVVNSKALL